MLTAQGLTKNFGDLLALDRLDLVVGPAEIYALLGANGAGKTTTIHLFLGFLPADAGRALVGGVDVASRPEAARRLLAYIPEQVELYRQLSGLENLAFFTRLAGRKACKNDLLDCLEQAGLPPRAAEARVSTYSKGMRQKVGIAIALAKQAQALLLDEPTSGLDPKAANEFSSLISRLAERGTAVLMATHDLFRAKQMARRVGILRSGRLVCEVETAALGPADLEALYLREVEEAVA